LYIYIYIYLYIYIYIHSLYSPLFCIFAIFNNIRYICYVQLSLLCAPHSLRGTRFAVFVILIYLRKIRLSFVYSLSSTIFAIFALFSYICHMRLIRYMGLTFLYSLIFSAMFASLLDSGRFFLQMAGPPELLCARLCAGAMCAMCGPFCAQVPTWGRMASCSLTTCWSTQSTTALIRTDVFGSVPLFFHMCFMHHMHHMCFMHNIWYLFPIFGAFRNKRYVRAYLLIFPIFCNI